MSKRVIINPGQLHFGRGALRLETLLGSCVAITLRHRNEPIGAMCHYLLPQRPHNKPPLKAEPQLDGRYGDEAAAILLRHIEKIGTRPQHYSASIFGGAQVLNLDQSHARRIGHINAQFAIDWLASLGIRPEKVDVSGGQFRYLTFDVESGSVHVRHGPLKLVIPTRQAASRAGSLI